MRKFIPFLFTVFLLLSSCENGNINTQESTPIPDAEPTTEIILTSTLDPNLPDLNGKTITIYLIGDHEEEFSSITQPFREGVEDYAAYINSHGGIFGAQLKLRFADTGGTPEGALTAYQRFERDAGEILLLILYGSAESGLYEQVNEDKIPTLSLGLESHLLDEDYDNQYVFRLTPTYEEQAAFLLKFITGEWDSLMPSGEMDEIRVAYLSWDDLYGKSALTEGLKTYISSLGAFFVGEEVIRMPPNSTATTAIFNAQMNGATLLYINGHASAPATLLNDLNSLAIRNFFVVGANMWALDNSLFDNLADPEFAGGLFIPLPYAWWSDEDNPAIQLAREIAGAEHVGSAGYLLGLGAVDLIQYALEQALLDVGYNALDAGKIYEVLTGLDHYQVMEGLFFVDYTEGKRSPQFLQIRQVLEGGEAVDVITVPIEIPDLVP